jgi:selenocysteine lyase/cysteine desulfurase
MGRLVYLDNAATTMRKPIAVRRAVKAALRKCGSPGRGGHLPSDKASEILFSCRMLASELFHVDSPNRIVFTTNATHALNIAINSIVQTERLAERGTDGRVLISGYEHNSVLRPLYARKSEGVETVPIISPLFEPEVFLHKLEREMDRGAGAVVCTHVSNVFGYILPIERVSEMCAKRGIPLIIDASQSAGCLDIDMRRLKAAKFICMPGHKGLLGPQGTGILICATDEAVALITGGTGADSLSSEMPGYLPERLEAGTPNVHGIAGLAEGIRYVLKRGTENILEHERQITGMIVEGLDMMPVVKVYHGRRFFCQTGVLSVSFRNGDCEAAAQALADKGICVRAGLHCAPLAHRSAATQSTGTLRISPSPFSKPRDAGRLIKVLRQWLLKCK